MPTSRPLSSRVANYRYFVAPVIPGSDGKIRKIEEIPFQNVTWGRAIREAGTFSGDIPVIEETRNLSIYENTLPGKTALYVMRNDECVWGGIIWSRSYNVKERALSINAAEFTSYLHHRAAWKTWSNDFEADITVGTTGNGTATLTYGTYDFSIGDVVYLTFTEENIKYSSYYTVKTVSVDKKTITFDAKYKSANIPELSDEGCTLQVRTNTYDYARGLLDQLKVDFFGIDFPNVEIEPGAEYFQSLTKISRSGNIATVTVDQAYDFTPGQRVTISDTGIAGFDGKYTVISQPATDKFTFANTGATVAETTLTPNTKTIITVERTANVATIQTSVNHGYLEGNIVTVEGIGGGFDGAHVITGVNGKVFTYTILGEDIALSPIDDATATVTPAVKFASYGEYTANSAIGFTYSQDTDSLAPPTTNEAIRGYELETFGDILDNYSDIEGGFEYRIDCSYDKTTDSFNRTFVFMPIVPAGVTDYIALNGNLGDGETYPITVFGAEEFGFAYPGNVVDVTLEESAEDAATRSWVRGNLDFLGEDSSQPYSAVAATSYLQNGWPILDHVEEQKNTGDEIKLLKYAKRYLDELLPPIGNLEIVVNGSFDPVIGTYNPGDWCTVDINDEFLQLRLQSNLEVDGTRQQFLRKIDSFSVTVPNSPSFPEEVSLQLVTEPGVDVVG